MISFDELMAAGSMQEAKAHGKVRIEGREYDGPTEMWSSSASTCEWAPHPGGLLGRHLKCEVIPRRTPQIFARSAGDDVVAADSHNNPVTSGLRRNFGAR